MTPGLHLGLPAADYHATMAMSAGGLKRMKRSPAHFFGLQLDPARPSSEPTDAMKAGTLFHTMLFEPALIEGAYAVRPPGLDLRTTDGKKWAAEAAGREIVTDVAMRTAKAQAMAVLALPDVAALLSDGVAESSAFWVDAQTGELCKCRPDWTSPAGDGVILVDGKTCQDASPDGFGRAIWTYAYHLQAAWYSDGFEAATGQRVHGFVFAAVEAAWPHAAAAYMLGDDVLDAARRENRRLLDLYAECRRSGTWPGYQAGINHINLPKWAKLENE